MVTNRAQTALDARYLNGGNGGMARCPGQTPDARPEDLLPDAMVVTRGASWGETAPGGPRPGGVGVLFWIKKMLAEKKCRCSGTRRVRVIYQLWECLIAMAESKGRVRNIQTLDSRVLKEY